MTWLNAPLSDEQHEVIHLVRSVVPGLTGLAGADGIDDPSAVAAAREALAESGIWSIGIDDELGGGGASFDLRQAAFIALGATTPSLALASAHAHVATLVVSQASALDGLCAEIVEGSRPVCIVEIDDPHVRLEVGGDRVHGVIGRLDPAGTDPAVIVLDGDDAAWVLVPGSITNSAAVRRTGLAGAMTISAVIDASGENLHRIEGVDLPGIRSSLYAAGSAIAAGIAVAAAEGALEYSRERVQFGAALTALPTVRAALVEQSSGAVESIALVLTASPSRADRAAAVLRDNCERAISIAGAALQSHGGYGYLDDYDVERLLRDAVSLRAATGASTVLHRVANALVTS
ncbi:acyl-CoA dehydrogenase family protein [Microbacterium pygmaeum]|uniref:Acyl-CoA dehydrogenase n=1 Tax=Microbacterium pygmaeum TaxID=370764 RepID=A0A1G7XEQ1_9MICO|nr:acyl-CoA dehydrogenase family protein [Microbacterium pygmaeum]SDG82745.1 Acyl-CoA dehydrogenase [Microbacterium pygmaeum]